MSDNDKDKDQEKGDAVLRRMLKTPPAPKEKPPTDENQKARDADKG